MGGLIINYHREQSLTSLLKVLLRLDERVVEDEVHMAVVGLEQ